MDNLQRAQELIAAGDLHEARELLVRLLYDDYDDAEVWFTLAQVTEDREEYARAVREVLRLDPENAEARRMAVELSREAAQAPRTRPDGSTRRRRGNRAVSFIYNFFIFLLIVAVAGGLALWWIDSNRDDKDETAATAPTPDPAVICARQVESVLERLPARCSLTEAGQVCLGNPDVFFAPQETGLLLPGDRGPLANFIALETRPFNATSLNFGLLMLRAKTAYADDTPANVLFLITSGVRLRDYDEHLTSLVFSSNPVVSECANVPPSGILVSGVAGQPAEFIANGLAVLLEGTAFLQVDSGAGLRVVALEGGVQIAFGSAEFALQPGQWISWPVDPTLVVRDQPSGVMMTANSVRGDLTQLVTLAQAAGLPTENWRLPGSGISPDLLASPTLPQATPEMTDEVESSPDDESGTRTPTPLPPDALPQEPLSTDEALPELTEEALPIPPSATLRPTSTPRRSITPVTPSRTGSPAANRPPEGTEEN